MLLLDDGCLYGCGDNSMNQLSNEDHTKAWQEWRLFNKERFQDVACGWEFTVAINQYNEVLCRGNGPKGELGLGDDQKFGKDLEKVMIVNEGSKLFGSLQNCVLIEPKYVKGEKKGSRVYGWGSNTKCQLFKPKGRSVNTPTMIFESDHILIDYVAMGKNFFVFVDTRGRIVKATGFLPAKFNFGEWSSCENLQVRCMWTSIHILVRQDLTEDRKRGIYSFGNNTHSQLFNLEKWELPMELENFAVGSEHGIIVYRNKESERLVACWGWGEHGNCGRLRSAQDLEFDSVNDNSKCASSLNTLISFTEQGPVKVFGGCATTWIATD